MPLPTASPSATTSTASPARKSPSTAVTPTGSRLEPRSRSTRAAPASITIRPQLGAGIGPRVGGVDAGGVGEQDQQPRPEEDRHLGGEEVVVAERDLVGRGG